MVRIAPVRFPFNPKTLWFDARDLEIEVHDPVVVLTARGHEFGYLDDAVFEATEEQISALSSPLKPVRRIASEEDVQRAYELERKGRDAMPLFRELAAAKAPDMNPVAVEFLFDSDKAVFYFESDDRIDFRDLVRDLAAQFRVRVDMKQIGVRDEARMVGGIGHCGQELCCTRLGGEFNPVSIRMAKEQGLSLNPQKISGLCGRLMCCLRYEYDAYKDFHARAPKKNALVQTPVGEGKVVDMDVPRETISILVPEEKPVVVPLADMEVVGDGSRPNFVGEEAWELAHATPDLDPLTSSTLLISQLTEKDKLAEPTSRKRGGSDDKRGQKQGASNRSARGKQGANDDVQPAAETRKPRRRRSTKVTADGSASAVEERDERMQAPSARTRSKGQQQEEGTAQARPSARSRRHRGAGARKQANDACGAQNASQQGGANAAPSAAKGATPGRKSSALRARDKGAAPQNPSAQQRAHKKAAAARSQHEAAREGAAEGERRVRRRTHRTSSGAPSGSEGSQAH